MMSDYSVEPINDGINELKVLFHGPKESKIFCPVIHFWKKLKIMWLKLL